MGIFEGKLIYKLTIRIPYGDLMLIRAVKIAPDVLIKIYETHFISSAEIQKVLLEGKPRFKKAGGEQYIAVGLGDRYLTIFFRYGHKIKEVTITTAYPSSRSQIKSYRRLRR